MLQDGVIMLSKFPAKTSLFKTLLRLCQVLIKLYRKTNAVLLVRINLQVLLAITLRQSVTTNILLEATTKIGKLARYNLKENESEYLLL